MTIRKQNILYIVWVTLGACRQQRMNRREIDNEEILYR